MDLNQISLISFWKINPGRYYTMHVPGFQQIPLLIYTRCVRGKAAAHKECKIVTRFPPRQRYPWDTLDMTVSFSA